MSSMLSFRTKLNLKVSALTLRFLSLNNRSTNTNLVDDVIQTLTLFLRFFDNIVKR